MSGVTAVVDVGGPLWTFEVREKARDIVMAPRIAVTGPLISYRPEELAKEDPPIIKVDSPEEGRALVQRLVEWEPDLIKIWFILSDGAGGRATRSNFKCNWILLKLPSKSGL
jgi:hypothetical protein